MISGYIMDPQLVLIKLQTPHEVLNPQVLNDQYGDSTIIKVMQQYNTFYEDEQGRKCKERVIYELKAILSDWLNQCRELQQEDEEAFDGEVHMFGSFRLGVNSKDGDIDIIVLAAPFVDREQHFFAFLMQILSANAKITHLYAIQEAMVPLIKFKFQGVPMDLVFAQLSRVQRPITSSPTLDEKSARSMNGLRVSEYFASKNNQKLAKFLKVIKLWAINRGLYGGVMGYLGGISWHILAAKIIQLYPNYCLTQLIDRFFFIYSQWRWSDIPVCIEKSTDDAWKSYIQDQQQQKQAVMTILTPIYPNINTTHNVSNCTLKIIQEQLLLGYSIIQKIKSLELQWSDLFKRIQFFDKYQQYIQVRMLSKTPQDLIQWKGHVESKLRKLNKLFDDSDTNKHFEVHLYPKSFDTNYIEGDLNDVAGKQFPNGESFFYGIRPLESMRIMGTINIEHLARQFCEQLEGQKPYLRVPSYLNIEIRVVSKQTIQTTPQMQQCIKTLKLEQ